MFGGVRSLLLPLGWFVLARGLIVRGAGATHALLDDWPGHIVYLPAFLFGLGLARSEPAWAGIRRWWKLAALLAIAASAAVGGTEWLYPGQTPLPPALVLPYHCIRALQGAAAVIALLGIADRFWNRDQPVRALLTEAVFPIYIVHQTIIVLTGWYLLRFGLSQSSEFIILLAVTATGCWLFYDVARRISWLRPLIGLKQRSS